MPVGDCIVCDRPEAAEINADIYAGMAYEALARKWGGFSRSTAGHHAKRCLGVERQVGRQRRWRSANPYKPVPMETIAAELAEFREKRGLGE